MLLLGAQVNKKKSFSPPLCARELLPHRFFATYRTRNFLFQFSQNVKIFKRKKKFFFLFLFRSSFSWKVVNYFYVISRERWGERVKFYSRAQPTSRAMTSWAKTMLWQSRREEILWASDSRKRIPTSSCVRDATRQKFEKLLKWRKKKVFYFVFCFFGEGGKKSDERRDEMQIWCLLGREILIRK